MPGLVKLATGGSCVIPPKAVWGLSTTTGAWERTIVMESKLLIDPGRPSLGDRLQGLDIDNGDFVFPGGGCVYPIHSI
jgi:hypothetical protein